MSRIVKTASTSLFQFAVTCYLLLLTCTVSAAPHIANWTESPGELGLGYPVPVPVNTPVPFDGFRSYNGLRTRHFELASTTEVVHRIILGTTQSGVNINAWQLGDNDLLNNEGLAEAATLTNGGIHAREWQSPETVTAIMELLAANENDDGFYRYLLDNANMLVIPSLNIDGFRQTQRYPRKSWLDTDPNDPQTSPRDGRMRRKNMHGVDTNLDTRADHLFGIDLNRNNPPFWATSNRSSANGSSIVHHGSSPHSESETQALAFAASFAPEDRLRMYTDVHSFSQVHFWHNTGDQRLARNTTAVLQLFTNFQAAFPAAKFYAFNQANQQPNQGGIGSTDEYFAETYKIPSWTLEIEPSGGDHPGLPGCGADYGGLASNCHDGFILPESEIRRVRETLAQSFTMAYYKQMGAASVRRVRIIDANSGAVVYAADWKADSSTSRVLHQDQLEKLVPGRDYQLWVAFTKPMRWRNSEGGIITLQGQSVTNLPVQLQWLADGQTLSTKFSAPTWHDQPGMAPSGYLAYRDDAFSINFTISDTEANRQLIDSASEFTLSQQTRDLTGDLIDANPATVVDWNNGGWNFLENSSGTMADQGGADRSLHVSISNTASAATQLIDSSFTGAWPDFNQDKQGLLLEVLEDNRAVIYWFTYDDEGNQRYLNAVGDISGNRIVFTELYETRGGRFSNPGFNPVLIKAGQAEIIFNNCDGGRMDYSVDSHPGHLDLSRLTNVMGHQCGSPAPASPVPEEMLFSGAWTNTDAGNHGLVLEVLIDSRIVAYWFSYDNQGNPRWFFGVGVIEGDEFVFDQMYTTNGGLFGKFATEAPADLIPWGKMRLQMSCADGVLSFDTNGGSMANGVFSLDRLTFIKGGSCPAN